MLGLHFGCGSGEQWAAWMWLETAANGTGHSVSQQGQCTVVSYIAMHQKSKTKSAL